VFFLGRKLNHGSQKKEELISSSKIGGNIQKTKALYQPQK
jgi:hypothetical protein